MKKLMIFASALALTFILTSCSGSTNTPLPSTNSSTPAPQSSAVLSAAGDVPSSLPDLAAMVGAPGLMADYDEATKKAMTEEAKADGGNLEFKPDGTTVYTEADGSKSVQNPDGTWTFDGPDNETAQFGGEWPENEFTKLLPKPDFTLLAASSSEGEFSVAFAGASAQQVKEYAKKVQEKGFSVDAETQEENVMGMSVYLFTAKNEQGYTVEVSFAAGTAGIVVQKP